MRWYEIRNPAAPVVYQQSTVVDPDVNYWLSGIAMDRIGNLALGSGKDAGYLSKLRRHLGKAAENDRKLVMHMAQKMAGR